MDPLRSVPIRRRSGEGISFRPEFGFPPVEENIPSREFAEVYLNFLDTLDETERRVAVERAFPVTSGEIADKLGIKDVQSYEFGFYCSDEPLDDPSYVPPIWESRSSATIEALQEDVYAKWIAAAVEAGITEPYNEGLGFTYDNENGRRNGYARGHDRLVKGFERVVAEIIYGDYGSDGPAENPYPHMIELMMDGARLRELVNRWYDENLEARQASREPSHPRLKGGGFYGALVRQGLRARDRDDPNWPFVDGPDH